MTNLVAHLRLVHFAQILISGTLLYLSLAAFNEGGYLAAEVRELQRITELDRELPLRHLNAEWYERHRSRLTDIFGIASSSWVIGATVRVTAPPPPFAGDTLVELRRYLDNLTVPIRYVSAESAGPSIAEQIERKFGSDCARNKHVDKIVVSWDGDVIAAVQVYASCVTPTPEGTALKEIGVKGHLLIAQGEFTTSRSWMSRFSLVHEHWDDVKLKDIRDVTSWSRRMSTAALSATGTISLLGFQFRAEDVGVLGPVAVLLPLLYLLAYTGRLRKLTDRLKAEDIVWIGLLDGLVARFVCFLTLVLMPVAGALFSAYMYSPGAAALGWASAAFVRGSFVHIQLRYCSQSASACREARR